MHLKLKEVAAFKLLGFKTTQYKKGCKLLAETAVENIVKLGALHRLKDDLLRLAN